MEIRSRRIVYYLFILNLISARAEIQWASYVIAYSTQLGMKQYSAKQALGEPNVMPNFGFSPCAWAPKYIRSKDGEFIHLGFENQFQFVLSS